MQQTDNKRYRFIIMMKILLNNVDVTVIDHMYHNAAQSIHIDLYVNVGQGVNVIRTNDTDCFRMKNNKLLNLS